MNCEHFNTELEECSNTDCPYCADNCPVYEYPEVCRYSGLDDTEQMLREQLDQSERDREFAIHDLVEEIGRLKNTVARLRRKLGRGA